ncbi:hypothetical protein SCUP234_02051 [Seiridium cupressi]
MTAILQGEAAPVRKSTSARNSTTQTSSPLHQPSSTRNHDSFLISLASLGMISQVVALPRAGATSIAPVGEALERSEDSVDGTQIAEGW